MLSACCVAVMLSEMLEAKDDPGHGLLVSPQEPVARASAAKDAETGGEWKTKAAATAEKSRCGHREAQEEHRKRIGGSGARQRCRALGGRAEESPAGDRRSVSRRRVRPSASGDMAERLLVQPELLEWQRVE